MCISRLRYYPAQRVPVEIWTMILRLATLDAHPTKFNNSRARDLFNDHDTAQANERHRQAIQRILLLVHVCHSWHLIARSFLFEWIVVSDPLRALQLSEVLRKEPAAGQPPDGSRVRRLVMDFGDSASHRTIDINPLDRELILDYGQNRESLRVSLPLLVGILSRCTKLEEFICDTIVLNRMMQYQVEKLFLASFCSFRPLSGMLNSLRFVYISGTEDHCAFEYSFFLTLCPNLKELQCACVGLGMQEVIVLPNGRALELESLTVYGCCDLVTGTVNISPLMASFGSLRLPNLRQFFLVIAIDLEHLGNQPTGMSPELEGFFRTFGTQLTSLGISEATECGSIAFAALAFCPNLREFSFSLGPQGPDSILTLVKEHAELRRICCTGFDDWTALGPENQEAHLGNVREIIEIFCSYPKLVLIRFCDIQAFRDFGLEDTRNPYQLESLYETLAYPNPDAKVLASGNTFWPYQICYDYLKRLCACHNVLLEMDHRVLSKRFRGGLSRDRPYFPGEYWYYHLYNNQLREGLSYYS